MIEGRLVPGPAFPGVVELAHLAAACRQVTVGGPDFGARLRMIGAFDDFTAGKSRRAAAWFLGWLGAGPRPRGLVERLAAGALLVVAAGGSVSAVAGDTPLAIARGTLNFVGNAVQNLGPSTSGGPALPTPDPRVTFAAGLDQSATPSTTPTPATATLEPPTPAPSAAAQGSSSPGGRAAPGIQPPTATSTPRTIEPTTQPPPATPTPTVQSPAPTATPTSRETSTPTPTPSATPTPLPTPSPTPSASPTPSPTPDGEEERRKEGGH